ncbi:TPM domain-containing protein [Phaeovulum sp.]|uniref:TPM domain-containing protein n=1 Tax=Phaeovulum sp. TaxID=2934796 RepID=UPI00272F899B|nr:TPM domain-containing protein [Phaeovulum sp.]MDP1670301.1 TPM domain-containing protein [Phaeovulum sp.]MDZ4120630.1 TPM domain-containing protein [Phaeovulum sp.]
MKRLLITLVLVLAPLAAGAEAYPIYASTAVNDYANLLEPDMEAKVVAEIEALRADTGVELTVLTIETRWAYDPSPSIEAFATGLFNTWGIGDAARDDGILILVVRDDREMRIELGSGYNPEYDLPAQDIINNVMLPEFRAERYDLGILTGTRAVADHIARRFAGLPMRDGAVPIGAPSGGGGGLVFGIVFSEVLFGAGVLALIFRRRIGQMIDRYRSCPECGQRGLHTERHVLVQPTSHTRGQGETISRCTHCSWSRTKSYTIPDTSSSSSSSGGSFGGGSSSGGGASGRW